ncbi:glycosyl hydrolase family 8 [Geodermatophilus sp. DSM 44513]|uniref:glycosyl hydrolase family 8 n=1 Tax=Geodermatophilus sp. DSM 44513 TaxID=1528104 RepID=UPI00141307D9|nr:glycosyl hydrolase family 8 [Geodermatophilus sp. DSM 44513]WNV75878.1 glycosyl hydrolase family 8 [Geodermatophilus sp. DSM 44513]
MRPDTPVASGPRPGDHALLRSQDRRRTRQRRRRRRTVVAAVVAAAAVVTVGVRAADDVQRAVAVVAADRPMVASEKTMLADLWRAYRENHVQADTNRTMTTADGVSTSQGQADTMLRAVWMDDQQTFADSWQWTKDNLQREDSLLASRFGERPDGSFGVQDELGGEDSVTGADVDVAFALLMAYSRWQEDDHLYDAVPVIEAVWARSVVVVDGEPVLAATDRERADGGDVLVNPSHVAPYAYRVFAEVDPDHDWASLVDSSYTLLEELAEQPLDAARPSGLPPDWVELDRRTGEYRAAGEELGTGFGTEALRSPWRLALDHAWNQEPRALRLLQRQDVLADSWTERGRLPAAYDRDGSPVPGEESPALYGGAMGYFTTVAPELADDVYATELLPLYDTDTGDLTVQLDHHDATWVWFGMALHLDELPDLNVTEE